MSVSSTIQVTLGSLGTLYMQDNLCTNTVYSNLCTNQHVGGSTVKYFVPSTAIASTLDDFLEFEFKIYGKSASGTGANITYVNTASYMYAGTHYTLSYQGSAETAVAYNVPCTTGSNTFQLYVEMWEYGTDSSVLRASGTGTFNKTVTIGANSVSAPTLTYSSRQSNQSIGLTVNGSLGTNNGYSYCLVYGKLGSAPTTTSYDRKSEYIYIGSSRTIANAFSAPIVTANQTFYVSVQLVGTVGSTSLGAASTMTITPDTSITGKGFDLLPTGTIIRPSADNWALTSFALNKNPLTTSLASNGKINSSGSGTTSYGKYFYIKFANGVMLEWMTTTMTNLVIQSGVSNGFYRSAAQSLGAFPIAFTSRPQMFVNVYSSGDSWAASPYAKRQTDGTIIAWCTRGKSGAATPCELTVLGIGKWN